MFRQLAGHVASLQYTQIHTVQSLIGSLNPRLTPFPCVPNLSRLIATGTAELRQSFYLSEEVSTQRLQTAAQVLIRKKDSKVHPKPQKLHYTTVVYEAEQMKTSLSPGGGEVYS